MKIFHFIFLVILYIFHNVAIHTAYSGPIGALAAILELLRSVESLLFSAGRELTQHRQKKRLLCTRLAIYVLNIFGVQEVYTYR